MDEVSEVDRITICDWAVDELWSGSPDCDESLEYLRKKRRLSDDVITRFQLGYVPREARHDLAGRLIMPLHDQHNKLVAITTRNFHEGAFMPHWHESFDKSRYLYGLHLAKRSILKAKKAIVIEGQFDTHALHDNGVDIAVAALGGALTYPHLCVLRRYCEEVYVWLDPDKAGRESTSRAMEMWAEESVEAFGLRLVPVYTDDGLDPDEYVAKHKKAGVISLLKESKRKANNALA